MRRAVLLVLLLTVAGCGGEKPATPAEPPAPAIRETLETYQLALWDNEPDLACAQITAAALEDIRERMRVSCDEFVEWTSTYMHSLIAGARDQAKAERMVADLMRPADLQLRITGDTATASPWGEEIPLALQADGSWKITAFRFES